MQLSQQIWYKHLFVSFLPCSALCDKEILISWVASLSSISQSCASGPQIVSADSRQFDFFFHPACRWWRWKDWRKQEWWTLHWQHSNYKLKIVICLKITWKCWLEWQKCLSGEELRIAFSARYGSFCVCMSSDQEGEWRCGWIWSRIICWQLAVVCPLCILYLYLLLC